MPACIVKCDGVRFDRGVWTCLVRCDRELDGDELAMDKRVKDTFFLQATGSIIMALVGSKCLTHQKVQNSISGVIQPPLHHPDWWGFLCLVD